ncbi:MAG: 50S ribosomal protein L22 [Actinobacteria bacterium]|uniref:Unannotated protein n=1 Tax=freshwater metagenome TaxID=449393 RepID=A0A6J6NST8_9ZZZZ|nr:50S ribosomal protein L22 [Actinomycetota bacterium]
MSAAPQTVRAHAKYVRSSAQKSRLVVDLIRGRSVPEARTILAFSTRAVSRDIDKVLRSAVANAETNLGWNGDDLVVQAAFVDEGPTLKRWSPRARGRVNQILKRTSHITILVAQADGVPVKPAAAAAPATTSKKADGGASKAKKSTKKKKEAVA